MTATERLFRGDSDEYMSMDDPRDYGNLIYELSFKEAINSNPPIISDYKIITFGITTPEIEKIAEDNKYLEVKKDLKDITARELATAIALRKAIKKLKIKNAISFHRSIKRAENFRKQQDLISKIYSTYGKLKTFHVRGDMPTSDRALEMLSFEEEQGLMTNARCLTEGVDLPAIDCVCFTDPKRSKVDIVQAAGRALRLSKGKKFGYILIPIFIPDGMDFDEAAEAQGFDDVSVTVRALASSDKRIVEYLRAISEGKKPRGGSPVDGVSSINELYKVEAEEFNKNIQLKVWDKINFSFYLNYSEAKKKIRSLNIKSISEYKKLYVQRKLPQGLPLAPNVYYKEKFENWQKFLNITASRFTDKWSWPNYKKFEKYVRKNKIKSINQWKNFTKSKNFNTKFPYAPNSVYSNKGWKSWPDLFGILKNRKKIDFIKYEDARKILIKNKIRSKNEYSNFRKSNSVAINFPSSPPAIYSKKWKGWPSFFGINKIANQNRKYLEFEKAREYLKKLKLKDIHGWEKFKKIKPDFIPSHPNRLYKNKGWKNLRHFLSNEKLSYEEAIKKVRSFNLKSSSEYKIYLYKHKNLLDILPLNPMHYYKKNKGEWISWSEFLGSNNISPSKRIFLNYEQAKNFLKKFNLKNINEFNHLMERKGHIYNNIPKAPSDRYSKTKEWVSWPDFLGKKSS